MAKAMDLAGRSFGILTVKKSIEYRDKRGARLWRCECECGGEREVCTTDLTQGRVTHCGCKSAPVNYTNQRFGMLTALEYTEQRNSDGKRLWRCVCDCGNEKLVTAANLKDGHTKSCGCQHHVSKVKIGDTFGNLTVIERVGSDKKGCITYLCQCKCGKENCKKEKIYSSVLLLHGFARSCKDFQIPDLTNKVFGHLTALRPTEKRAGTNIVWECECECGNIVYRTHSGLRAGGKNSNCGCMQTEIHREVMRKSIHRVEDTVVEKIQSSKPTAGSKTGVRGVYYNRRNQKWRASIGFKKKQIYLGEYNTLAEAAEVRRIAENEIYKPFLEAYYRKQIHTANVVESELAAAMMAIYKGVLHQNVSKTSLR